MKHMLITIVFKVDRTKLNSKLLSNVHFLENIIDKIILSYNYQNSFNYEKHTQSE